MAEKEYILTQEGKDELEKELETLKNVTRKEVSEKIKEARSFGDLSENAEYDEARNEQAEVEAEIAKLEEMIKFAKVVDNDDTKSDMITPGTKVTLYDIEFDEEVVYTIVGSMEADLANGKLSYESPVGAALLNKKVGETIEVKPFDEVVSFKILKIEK